MAAFIFLIDFEEGHLYSTFGFSKSLKDRGHTIHYVGILDIKNQVLEHGFEFHAVLKNQYPAGFRENFKKAHINKGGYSKFTLVGCIENELPVLLEQIKPQGIITSTHLCLESLLIYYRYGIKPVIFMPVINSNPRTECRYGFNGFRKKQRYELFHKYKLYNNELEGEKKSYLSRLFRHLTKSVNNAEVEQFISPIMQFEQLIACPQEFELPDRIRKGVHYIGPCIRNNVERADALINQLKSINKKIVYLSLGTQTERIHHVCESFYLKVIDLMKDPEMAGYHIVLSSKSAFQMRDTLSVSENITIVPWINAFDILQISSAVITHGGLGTLKESIFYGVPMIVLPDKYDQPINAKRIVHHQLGVQDDLITITKDRLKHHLQKVTTDQTMRDKLQQMKDDFRRREALQEGATLVEKAYNLN